MSGNGTDVSQAGGVTSLRRSCWHGDSAACCSGARSGPVAVLDEKAVCLPGELGGGAGALRCGGGTWSLPFGVILSSCLTEVRCPAPCHPHQLSVPGAKPFPADTRHPLPAPRL